MSAVSSTSDSLFKSRVNLPKIEIVKFTGNPTHWITFIDSFEAAVNKNDCLTNVEKMNYLITLVKDDAAATIQGLKLSNDNYPIALNLLRERFGDPQMLISAHMNELLNFQNVNDFNNIKELRSLYDKMETQVRSLNNLGIESKNYGSMLVPVFLSKLPTELKLIISRKFGKNLWDIESVIEAFKFEIEARERIVQSTFENSKFDSDNPLSGQALYSGRNLANKNNFRATSNKKVTCIFCNNEHRPQNCTVVKSVIQRKRDFERKTLLFHLYAERPHGLSMRL